MQNVQFDAAGDLAISPSDTSSFSDFDFLIGSWQVRNVKLKTRLNGCTEWVEFVATQELRTVLFGQGNIDHFRTDFFGKPFEGLTLRLFNPLTRLWSIYWADSNAVTLDAPVSGSFQDYIGYFFTRDSFEGKPIIMQFRWDATNPEEPVWSQAFSADNGQSWEWNWYMYFSRL
ncbi:hypothetical protein [Paraflavitalea pollutisoli]|uniref:hypothetical protein n=1 Tax=Paraflavitalea pollutisoli TaxID=3034143 RepID=UPI0023EB6506|nr:hypothetical protein [Paraflavitalea sp. H1-2-19X]